MRDTFRMILSGSRPRTWALSLCPVLIAALSAFHDVHAFEKTKRIPSWAYFMQHDGRLILLSAVVAVSLQVCANFANDYLDGVRGIDKARSADAPARLNSQASGIRIARCAAIVSATIGACAGIAAVLVSKQYWLIAVGIICIGAAWSYSSFFSARGWGETLAFIFFGPVLVWSISWLLTAQIGKFSIAAGIQCGCMSALVMLINNMRDAQSDEQSGKRTVVVRWGLDRAFSGACAVMGVVWIIEMMYALTLYHMFGYDLIGDLGILYAFSVAAFLSMSFRSMRCLRAAIRRPQFYRNAFALMNELMLLLTVNYVVLYVVVNAL